MPPRSETFPGGILRLQKLIADLNTAPKLTLHGVKALRVAFSPQGDHIGARHFVKEHLPRIRWANPALAIEVQKVRKTSQEKWRPELEIELENGSVTKVDMHNKVSTVITEELMDVAGGDKWKKHAFANRNAGIPVLPGGSQLALLQEEINEKVAEKARSSKALPSLQEYLKANPQKAAEPAKKKSIKSKDTTSTTKEKPEKVQA